MLAGPARSAPSEYELKAAMLYNFCKFVEWPAPSFATSGSPVVIGILGQDPFGELLEQIVRGKTVDGRSVVTRRWKSVDEIEGVHLLFISVSERKNLPHILAVLGTKPILSVGDMDRFAAQGGDVNFRLEGTRIRFVINPDEATRGGLKVSAKLLALAEVVRSKR
jgi:hypothetical protein